MRSITTPGLVDEAAQALVRDLRASSERPVCPGCPFSSCVTTTRPVTDVIAAGLRVDDVTAIQLRRELTANGQLVATPVVDAGTRTVLCVEVAVFTA